uniref:Uncharacterized protein n=1 Tax=Candidatus Kentrum sp. TC TaxID=2126339 RepID=A0A450Z9I8_9GAMM|nr:MAG: hypothetical protein BECKTC1821D_GA0114238_11038 [Candidatus Kentron sp. TC]
MAEGREGLQGSRYDRLCDQANRTPEKRPNFRRLRDSALKTARAWAIENWPCRYGVMQDLGAQGLETAAIVDHALSFRTDKEGRQDNQGTSVRQLFLCMPRSPIRIGMNDSNGLFMWGRPSPLARVKGASDSARIWDGSCIKDLPNMRRR